MAAAAGSSGWVMFWGVGGGCLLAICGQRLPGSLRQEVAALIAGLVSGRRGSSFAFERDRQAWDDERCEEERQDVLPVAAEGDDLALGGFDGLGAARVSAVTDFQGVTPGFDLHLDRVVHFDRRDVLAVDHDVERATADLHADCPSRQLERCRHFDSPFRRIYGLLALPPPDGQSFCLW